MSPLLTRRWFGKALAASVLARALPARSGTPAAAMETLGWDDEPCADNGCERRYRVDAQALLLSMPVLHREGVGGGSVVWRESPGSNGVKMIKFTGFSRPESAAGLHRLGWIQEISATSANGDLEALYFGLMTASPEDSVVKARQVLHRTDTDLAYTTIEGRIGPRQIVTTTAHFTAPAELSAGNGNELLERARRALSAAPSKSSPSEHPRPRPFLQTLADLLRANDRSQSLYSYNGRTYRLCLRKSRDAKATALFRERRMIGPDAQVIRADGKVRPLAGGDESDFRLWVEEGADRPLPLRIEYQPRSYLRLTFVAVA